MSCKGRTARSARSAMAGSTTQNVTHAGVPSFTTSSPASNQDGLNGAVYLVWSSKKSAPRTEETPSYCSALPSGSGRDLTGN